ncbi:MAG: glycosyltransferase [Bacteroidales bacterium]|nr:glycosyltransferase [Bacteroidales bacterium]
MRLLEVNTVAYGSSVGAYMRSVAHEARRRGVEVAIAKGRRDDVPGYLNIDTSTPLSLAVDGLATRLFDLHGRTGARATRNFIEYAEGFAPDVIHLHNIHGYYLHYPTFFEWLKDYGAPVFWTLHDCWALTGHCPFPESGAWKCPRRAVGCGECTQLREYPQSLFADRSASNFDLKAKIFTSVPDLTLLPVSQWMSDMVASSPLADLPRHIIKIDIDTDIFRPTGTPAVKRVLGVATNWDKRKSPDFFSRLRNEIPDDVEIRIVGKKPRHDIAGITFTGVLARKQLVEEYSRATVFVNPTMAESYGLVNREAIACGCPVVTRNAGGATEGLLTAAAPVLAGDTDDELIAHTRTMLAAPESIRTSARESAMSLFDGRPGMNRLIDLLINAI